MLLLPNLLLPYHAYLTSPAHTHTQPFLSPPYPSISALFIAKNSLSHFNGFSGSVVARCFIASSKCGVTF